MAGQIGQLNYPTKHAGPLLVVGSAPCALEDFDAARKLYPHAYVMAINEGAAIVEASFIASLHAEKMRHFAALQRDLGNPYFTTHAAAPDVYFPAVDYYWTGAHTGATSAWCGVLIGKAMGFGPIVLCGCPLNGGDGYFVQTSGTTPTYPRFGFMPPGDPRVQSYRAALERAVERGEGAGVYSMGGFTRSLLGGPNARALKAAG